MQLLMRSRKPAATWAFQVVQHYSILTMQEMWVWSLGWGDPLEYEMATPEFLPEKFQDRETWWAPVHGAAKSQTDLSTHARCFSFLARTESDLPLGFNYLRIWVTSCSSSSIAYHSLWTLGFIDTIFIFINSY